MRSFKALSVFFILFSITGCLAQKRNPLKIYAYYRPVMPGNIAVEIKDGEQKENVPAGQTRNYYIYAELVSGTAITVTGVWINSVFYKVRAGNTTTATPVTVPSFRPAGESPVITLVPSTKNKVFVIAPEPATEQINIPVKFDSNQLIIRYILNNKEKYTAVKKIQALEPEIRQ